MKRQHQNPEFGHTQGEIIKKPVKKYISIQRGERGGVKKKNNNIFLFFVF
jgi:hypothetical protein